MKTYDQAQTYLGRAQYALAQGVRSAWYQAHLIMARRRSSPLTRPGDPPYISRTAPLDKKALRRAFLDVFRQDRANIEEGLYPAPQDFRFENIKQVLDLSQAFLEDAKSVDQRRTARAGMEIRHEKPDLVEKYPAYYRQNFHYQTDGWLSDESARLYDTQVETLFSGAADAMRRAALAEIARVLRGRDQRAQHYLDLACGTGRFLSHVMTGFPKLQAAGLDLSPHYAKAARKATQNWPHVNIAEGAGEDIPFCDHQFDLLSAIYLFHEIPPKLRSQIFREIARVLKPEGIFIFADSLQYGDVPGLDAVLEVFPEGFHEPYYKTYLNADLGKEIEAAGFALVKTNYAFLTKIQVWRKH